MNHSASTQKTERTWAICKHVASGEKAFMISPGEAFACCFDCNDNMQERFAALPESAFRRFVSNFLKLSFIAVSEQKFLHYLSIGPPCDHTFQPTQ